jgi:hypothetical protein
MFAWGNDLGLPLIWEKLRDIHKFIVFLLPAGQLTTAQTPLPKIVWISSVLHTLGEIEPLNIVKQALMDHFRRKR